jgi:subtilisin family serine protease
MKRFAFALFVLSLIFVLSVATVSAQGTNTFYTIVFRGNSTPGNVAQLVQNAGGQLLRAHPEIGVAAAISSDPNFAANMSRARGVSQVGTMSAHALPPTASLVAQPDAAPTPADDLFALQWDIRRVNADQAWALEFTGSHNTVVAVIDTGIASNHPDLAPNLVYRQCYNTQPTCSLYPDLHWHGTHVAGTVAAAFGGGRIVGVGPNLGLASYNVFELVPNPEPNPPPGEEFLVLAFDEPIWAAMIDAANRGFKVINMSLGDVIFMNDGGAATWTAWNRVANYVARQGVTIVASAGNETTNSNGPVAHIPSDLSDVISVGATGVRPNAAWPQAGGFDVLAFYSNFGAAVDLVAPGGDLGPNENSANYLVLSAFPLLPNNPFGEPVPANCVQLENCPPAYAFAAGTSMASPHVAGVAGLILDIDPGLNPQQAEARLRQTAQDIGSRQLFGHGMVDALAAVLRVS